MSKPHIIDVTPWPHTKIAQPDDSVLVCTYQNYIGIDHVEETLFHRRTDQRDELWIHSWLAAGLAAARPSQDDIAAAVVALVGALVRSRVGFGWPTQFVRAGLIGRTQFEHLLAEISAELDANWHAAALTRSKIVDAATSLGLSPEPAGTDPRLWRAQCPKTNHFVSLNTQADAFFCGWCKRSGGVDELATFVHERRDERGNGQAVKGS